MSTTFHYDVGVVFDNTGRPIPNAKPLFRLATLDGPGAVAPVVDTDGDATEIVTSEYGAFSRFNYVSADGILGAWGYLDVNGVIQSIASVEVLNSRSFAQAAQAAAQAAQAAAEASALAAAQAAAGGGGGGSGGVPGANTVGSGQIADGSVGTPDLADDAVTRPKIGPAAVGPDEIATGAVGSDELAASAVAAINVAPGYDNLLVHRALAETITGVKTFSVSPTVPTPTNPTDVANRAFVLANAGGGSGSPFGTLIYCIPAADLVSWPAAGTGAQKMAAINANDARIVHEMVTRPGYHIETDPSEWWPCSLTIDEFVGTYTRPDGTTGNLVEGADYSLGGRLLMCKGTRTSSTDTSSNVVQSGNVLTIARKPANNGLVITPTLKSVQLGSTGSTNLGSYFTAVCTGFDASTNLALFKAGSLLDLVSQNEYGYSSRAGYGDGTAGTGVYKGAFFPIAGLCINVTGYSLTALNTALGTGNTVSTLERRTLLGAQSGVTALVQGGDFGANGQLLVNSVSGNWTAGEQIKDQATGTVVATYSSTTVCMVGSLNCDYDITPQLRFVTRSYLNIERVMIRPDAEIDDVIEGYNRPDAVQLVGCTGVRLDGIRILGGYSTGITLRSCFDVTGLAHVRDLPNHALESVTERSYGYALRWLGHCQAIFVGLDVMRVRHGTTSNAIRGTWNLNARTGQSNGATSLCTNFWNHGPGLRKFVLYGRVENTWSACWDFHEGAEEGELLSPAAINPSGSGRATTSPDGFSIRGFGITVLNAYTDGCRIGIYDLAGPLNSGGLAYVNRYIGGTHLRCQAGGFMQSEDVFDESLHAVEVRGNTFTCDPLAKGAYTTQFGALVRRGISEFVANKFGLIGYAVFRFVSFVGSAGSNATGLVLLKDNELDWTGGASASRPFSVEATYSEITEVGTHARVNAVAGSAKPTVWVVNSGGNSLYRYGGRTTSHLSTTRTDPSSTPSITGGAPTFVNLDAGGAAAAPTHDVSVLPTVTSVGDGNVMGTGGTVTLDQGNTAGYVSDDLGGQLRITCGTPTATPAAGAVATVTFGTQFATVPKVRVFGDGNAAATDRRWYLSNVTTAGFTVNCGANLVAQLYKVDYTVAGV